LLKIAMVGLSQLSFAGDKEGRYHKTADDLTRFLVGLDAELYVYREQVIVPDDAYKALREIKAQEPDFLLVQCTSFSAGLLAQIFAKSGYPIGFWAIPEDGVSGAMLYNSFCSINMYGAIVRSYYPTERIPIKWFFGEVGDELFAPRMTITVNALRAIKAMNHSRVALIGGIAPGFNDLYFDERKLLARFPGMQFNRLHEFNEIADRARAYSDQEVADMANAYDAAATQGVDKRSMKHHMTNVRFLKAYRDFLAEYHYDALAVSCWPKFQSEFDYSICSVVGQLNDEGVPTACEGDVPSAVSMLLLKNITRKDTTLMDMSSFDEKDDTVLLWHCGPAAKCFARNGYELGVNYSGKAHIKGQPPVGCGVTRDMVFKPMDATIGHIAGESDQLLVAGGHFIEQDKPSFCGSRGWLGNLSIAGEKLGARDFISTILDKGLSHHYPVAQGDVQNELMETACWLNMKVIEKTTYKPYLKY